MADDLDELGRRLDRIEQLLRRPREATSRLPAGPEVRSARSIVSRVDDVWVAVTEGNERVVATIEGLRTELAAAVAALAGAGAPPAGDGNDDDRSGQPDIRIPESGLPRIGNVGAAPARPEDDDPVVHLRLNRIEEALAGIAGRLDDLAADRSPPSPPPDATGTHRSDAMAVTALADSLGAEVRRLGERVEALARALEDSAARSADDTLAHRLGRLRDQFRR